MKYRVVIYNEAHNDIDRNAAWWARNHSYDQAVTWVQAVYDQIATLDEMPKRCELASENDEFEFEIRQLLVGKGNRRRYRAVFTIQDKTVHVLALLAAEQEDLISSDLPNPQS